MSKDGPGRLVSVGGRFPLTRTVIPFGFGHYHRALAGVYCEGPKQVRSVLFY